MKNQRSSRVIDASEDREALGLVRGEDKLQMKQKKDVIEEQDKILDEIGENVTKVGKLAEGIQEQIDNQRYELEIMEDGMNKANTNLDYVTRRTKAIIDRGGGKRQCCIQICLGVVALVLLLLVIYT